MTADARITAPPRTENEYNVLTILEHLVGK